jgi:hypothetical protein
LAQSTFVNDSQKLIFCWTIPVSEGVPFALFPIPLSAAPNDENPIIEPTEPTESTGIV